MDRYARYLLLAATSLFLNPTILAAPSIARIDAFIVDIGVATIGVAAREDMALYFALRTLTQRAKQGLPVGKKGGQMFNLPASSARVEALLNDRTLPSMSQDLPTRLVMSQH